MSPLAIFYCESTRVSNEFIRKFFEVFFANIEVSAKSVDQKCWLKVSVKSVGQKYLLKVSAKSIDQKYLLKVSTKSVGQKYLLKVSTKSVGQRIHRAKGSTGPKDLVYQVKMSPNGINWQTKHVDCCIFPFFLLICIEKPVFAVFFRFFCLFASKNRKKIENRLV